VSAFTSMNSEVRELDEFYLKMHELVAQKGPFEASYALEQVGLAHVSGLGCM
jgi:hypothetical protein